MRRFYVLSLVNVVAFVLIASADAAEKIVNVSTPDGNRQAFLLINQLNAKASVILFAGGSGLLDIDEYGPGKGETNFLVRSRKNFAGMGFNTVTIDASSAYQSYNDGLTGFRSSESHARDVGAVISYLKKKNGLPVWLVGTSRGTISAANAAARLGPEKVRGLVLSASVTGTSRRRPENIYDVPLDRISSPVLLVNHKRDGCKVTPNSGMKRLKRKLKNASLVELKSFKGGTAVDQNPCRGLSYHGFYGIEDEVIRAITNWIAVRN